MSYNERLTSILAAFGIQPTQHLPVNGAAPRVVDVPAFYGSPAVPGVRVWIAARATRVTDVWRGKSSRHRVLCQCPKCGAVLSAGRLHQHVDTARCVARTLGAR